MNWSIYTADRATHLKIVVVGLAAALLIAVIGISARELNLGTDILTAQFGPIVVSCIGSTFMVLLIVGLSAERLQRPQEKPNE